MPQRLDHFQLLVPDVRQACEFYMQPGLPAVRIHLARTAPSDMLMFVFLQRKGNPHDIVFAPRAAARGCTHAAFSAA